MEYVYAALILHETDGEINEENITGVLEAAGVDVEESRVKALVAALEDVDITEAVEGAAAVPAGGAGGAAPATTDDGGDEAEADDEGGDDGGDEAEEADADEGDDDDDASGEGLGELFG